MRGSWPTEFPSIQSSNKSIYYLYFNPFYPLLQPQCCSSRDPMTKDDALGFPANLGQPGDVLALTGSLPGESFDSFFASLPKN